MAASSGYVAYVLEQLEALGPVSAKPMFGGRGLYFEGLFFGLISSQDELYFKIDDANRGMFEERGCAVFQPMPGKGSMNYMTVPEDVLEDPRELADWARSSVAAAGRKAR